MQQHGRATITVNGTRLRSKNGATLLLGGVTRAPEALDSGEVAFSESTAAPELSCNIALTRDTDIEALRNLTGATVVFESDTGKSWSIRDAFAVDAITVGADVALKISGQPATEI